MIQTDDIKTLWVPQQIPIGTQYELPLPDGILRFVRFTQSYSPGGVAGHFFLTFGNTTLNRELFGNLQFGIFTTSAVGLPVYAIQEIFCNIIMSQEILFVQGATNNHPGVLQIGIDYKKKFFGRTK